MGKLQGITLTPELSLIVETVLALSQPTAPAHKSQKKGGDENNDDGNSSSSSSSSLPSSSSARSAASTSTSSPSALIGRAQEANRALTQSSPTVQEAKILLETATSAAASEVEGKNDKSRSAAAFLPLAGVAALKCLIDNSTSESNEKTELTRRLESALRRTALSFAPKTKKPTDPAYQKRLERLRLQDEERSYNTLTTNLKTASSLKDDNVTAKSMMYATSVGLNMVVAPITFGAFMYFFAGSIFARFFDDEERNRGRREGDIDVRRVIAGVVSGVFMLFVEMILFVIRSHELDSSVRRKARRKENRANPFGYTQKSMERVYVRED